MLNFYLYKCQFLEVGTTMYDGEMANDLHLEIPVFWDVMLC
jgi:hypothetical protein